MTTTLFLTCDTPEFEAWLHQEYPHARMVDHNQNPDVFTFLLDDNSISVGHMIEAGKHKYFLECEPGPSSPLLPFRSWVLHGNPSSAMAFEFFLTAVRNRFGLPAVEQPVLAEKDQAMKAAENNTELTDLDKLCIMWARRDSVPFMSMSDFLHEDPYGEKISKDIFKKALQQANKKGLIVKVKNRWRLPNSH